MTHADPTSTSAAGALGRSVRRKEDQRLVTGHGRYVSDLQLPRMRHVAFLRSPLAHAQIASVDTSAAAAAGHRVFTGTDFAHVALRAQSALPSYVETDQPVLAHDKVRYAGEPVAAVPMLYM
jgi:aerobic carbon-monoxide dehydrogenase large subunit